MTRQRIRPIAICVFRHQNRILVFEGYDPARDQIFYRPLGGSIEFGEHSSAAVTREIKEELGADISNVSFLGSIENIFSFNDRAGHEFVQVYDAEFVDPRFYQQESPEAYEADGSKLNVMWKNLEFFKSGKAPLYPTGLLELLERNDSKHLFANE